MIKDFTFESQGCRLEATFYAPDLKKKTRLPIIIIVPGGNGRVWKKDDGSTFIGYEKLAEELSELEFVTVTFDGRGQGRSEGKRTMDNMAEDLNSLLNMIHYDNDNIPKVKLIDKSRVGITGVCFGGLVVCRQLIGDDRVKSVAIYGGVPSWMRCVFKTREHIEKWKTAKGEVGTRVDFDAEIRLLEEGKYDLVNTLPQLTQNVLIANGTEDKNDRYDYDFMNYVNETILLVKKMKMAKSAVFSMINKGSHTINYGEEAFGSFRNLIMGWFLTTL